MPPLAAGRSDRCRNRFSGGKCQCRALPHPPAMMPPIRRGAPGRRRCLAPPDDQLAPVGRANNFLDQHPPVNAPAGALFNPFPDQLEPERDHLGPVFLTAGPADLLLFAREAFGTHFQSRPETPHLLAIRRACAGPVCHFPLRQLRCRTPPAPPLGLIRAQDVCARISAASPSVRAAPMSTAVSRRSAGSRLLSNCISQFTRVANVAAQEAKASTRRARGWPSPGMPASLESLPAPAGGKKFSSAEPAKPPLAASGGDRAEQCPRGLLGAGMHVGTEQQHHPRFSGRPRGSRRPAPAFAVGTPTTATGLRATAVAAKMASSAVTPLLRCDRVVPTHAYATLAFLGHHPGPCLRCDNAARFPWACARSTGLDRPRAAGRTRMRMAR